MSAAGGIGIAGGTPAPSGAYSQIGPYHAGYWLVSKGQQGSIVNSRGRLPAEGQGYRYYWLGSSAGEANVRILDALGKLGVSTTAGQSLDVTQANRTGVFNLTKWPSGIAGIFKGVDVIPWPLSKAALAGDAAAAGGAADVAATGGAAGTASKLGSAANAAKAALTGASLFSFLTAGGWWAGMGMVLAGAALIAFGLYQLAGAGRSTALRFVR